MDTGCEHTWQYQGVVFRMDINYLEAAHAFACMRTATTVANASL